MKLSFSGRGLIALFFALSHPLLSRSQADTGKVVFNPEVEYVYTFSDGLAPVVANGKYGFVNKAGKLVIPPTYDWAYPFTNGLASVLMGDKYGYINTTGKIAIPMQYQSALSFSGGIAVVSEGNQNWYINKQGVKAASIPNGTSATSDYLKYKVIDKGLIPLRNGKDGNMGFVNVSGKYVVKPQFTDMGNFSEGLFAFYEPAMHKWGYRNLANTVVIPPRFNSGSDFSERKASFPGYITDTMGGQYKTVTRYGFIDKKGNTVIKPAFAYVCDFSEGLAFVSRDGEVYEFIDSTGKTAIGSLKLGNDYIGACYFSGGMAFVHIYTSDGHGEYVKAIIDKKGNILWQSKITERVCFAPGTEITLADGTHKKIETICPGDLVLAFDSIKQQFASTRVLASEKHYSYTMPLTTLSIMPLVMDPAASLLPEPMRSESILLRVTPAHPIPTNKGVKRVWQLKSGDIVWIHNERTGEMKPGIVEEITRSSYADVVYNLKTEARSFIANQIIVLSK
ncbi:MAG: WG repeat-containing protein [Bacteroidia bacterium]